VTTWFSTLNTSDPAKSAFRGNIAVFVGALAVLVAIALYLAVSAGHPIAQDAADAFIGP
jgi:hypothetical protein